MPGVKRFEELLRLNRRVLGDIRKQQFLVRTEPLLDVPVERKLDIVLSYRVRD